MGLHCEELGHRLWMGWNIWASLFVRREYMLALGMGNMIR